VVLGCSDVVVSEWLVGFSLDRQRREVFYRLPRTIRKRSEPDLVIQVAARCCLARSPTPK
jgi:hypothetical protein